MHRLIKQLAVLLTLWSLHSLAQAEVLQSVLLQDRIIKGVGDIDVLVDSKGQSVDVSIIEQMRQSNDGALVFGVDVNESSSGTEKASTQGVAIEQATLTITFPTGEISTSNFTTQTKTVVARESSELREEFYTLIGRTGSNTITGSSLHGTSMDATLTFPLAETLSGATAIHLAITFVATNISLGDPEAFYDFSAGFEDLALLTMEDRNFLDNQAAGRNEAPLVVLTEEKASVASKLYYPSADNFYIVAYEDEYPKKGDYDLNDLVVGYRVTLGLDKNGKVSTIEAEGYLIARGGFYAHDWHLRIPFDVPTRKVGQFNLYQPPGSLFGSDATAQIDVSDDLDIKVFSDTVSLFTDPNYAFVNTLPFADLVTGSKFYIHIGLETPVDLNKIGQAPFDPYLYVRDTGYEIHLSGKAPVHPQSINYASLDTSFTDANGFPFAYIFPPSWKNPLEKVDVGVAYPDLIQYIQSNKLDNQDWYLNAREGFVSKNAIIDWQW